MKVALSCDHLLARDHQTEVLEMFLSLYEDAEIYTLAHRERAILGPIEMRKIHSTFLSNIVTSVADFHKYQYVVPNAAKNLFIPCKVDLIINISRGLSHGIRKCKNTKQITYLYDEGAFINSKKTLREKFFSPFVKNWSKKCLQQIDYLWVSSEALKASLLKIVPHKEIFVLPPFFKIDDFNIFPKNMFPYDYCTINAEPINIKQAQMIVEMLQEFSLKYVFVGEDTHLQALKNSANEKYFCGGQKCAGELAPILAGARAHIDYQKVGFPLYSLKTQSTGRPIIACQQQQNFVTGPAVQYIQHLTNLRPALAELNKTYLTIDGQKMRANALKYHPAKFRGEVQRVVQTFKGL